MIQVVALVQALLHFASPAPLKHSSRSTVHASLPILVPNPLSHRTRQLPVSLVIPTAPNVPIPVSTNVQHVLLRDLYSSTDDVCLHVPRTNIGTRTRMSARPVIVLVEVVLVQDRQVAFRVQTPMIEFFVLVLAFLPRTLVRLWVMIHLLSTLWAYVSLNLLWQPTRVILVNLLIQTSLMVRI